MSAAVALDLIMWTMTASSCLLQGRNLSKFDHVKNDKQLVSAAVAASLTM